MGWEEIYAFEKFLPILTRWQVINFQYVNDCISAGRSLAIKGILHVDYIKKIRNPKGKVQLIFAYLTHLKFFK